MYRRALQQLPQQYLRQNRIVTMNHQNRKFHNRYIENLADLTSVYSSALRKARTLKTNADKSLMFGIQLKPWQRNLCIGSGAVLGTVLFGGLIIGGTHNGVLYCYRKVRNFIAEQSFKYPEQGIPKLGMDFAWFGFNTSLGGYMIHQLKISCDTIRNDFKTLFRDLSKNPNNRTAIECITKNVPSITASIILMPITLGGLYFWGHYYCHVIDTINKDYQRGAYSTSGLKPIKNLDALEDYQDIEENVEKII